MGSTREKQQRGWFSGPRPGRGAAPGPLSHLHSREAPPSASGPAQGPSHCVLSAWLRASAKYLLALNIC